jgi:hypothetical protein
MGEREVWHEASVRPSLFIAFLILGACGGDDATMDATDDAAGGPRETVTETKTLIGSEIIEGTIEGGPTDRAMLRITANSANLDWNIHGHAGGSSTVVEGLQVMTVEHEFVPPADEHWSVLLRNHSAVDSLEVTLEVDLYGDMVWETFGAHDE